jgi:hypothetical protein
MRFRISLLGAGWVVAFVGLALTAIREGSVAWITGMAWMLVTLLSAAILGVIYRRGPARVFWSGFAVFGWVYLLMVHSSMISNTLSDQVGQGLRAVIEEAFEPPAPTPGALAAARALELHEFARFKIRVRIVTDLVLNLAFACLGGVLAFWFAATAERDRRPGPEAGNPPEEPPARPLPEGRS